MRKLLILVFIVSLSGCAEINAIRNGIGIYGQQASDRALDDVLWVICKATPVGAVKRKFDTPQKRQIYRNLCSI